MSEARNGGRTISPRVRRLVEVMDEGFRVPGTRIHFGLEAIIGLVPGFGDFAGMIVGSVVFFEGVRLRVPYSVLTRMLVNLWLDSLIGSLPVIGDAFDFVFKANRRNLRLLERYA